MAYFRIEWPTDEWPTANEILDYAQGAWDRLTSTDPVFRERNGLIMADELFTAISRKVIGKSAKVHATRPKGSMGRSIELLHVLNTNEI